MEAKDWNDIWVALQELGAAMRPVVEGGATPPRWALRLRDAMDLAEKHVEVLALTVEEL